MKRSRIVLFALGLVFPAFARAHLRDYLETYGYYTLQKGHAEMEIWTDYRVPDESGGYWVNQTELEYGVTDRYTLGGYGVFVEGQGFSAIKIENRYRLAEKGQWPVDTALYLEFKLGNGGKADDEIESKIILSKDWGDWNVTANPILALEKEREASGEEEWELETSLAIGTLYRGLWDQVTPGVELFIEENKTRLIPGLYIDLLPEIRLNLGVGIGLEPAADNVQYKSILEVEF